MRIRSSFGFSVLLIISSSHAQIFDTDGLVYDQFIAEPDLYGWDDADVTFVSDFVQETPTRDDSVTGRSREKDEKSEEVKTIKLIAASMNYTDADMDDPAIEEKMHRRLRKRNKRDTRESLATMLSSDHTGRAWTLSEPGGLITTLTGPSAVECANYKRADKKCYLNVGCFGHGHSSLDHLCRLPEERMDISYKIFTKSDRKGKKIPIGSIENFDGYKEGGKVVFYFHGYTGDGVSGEALDIKEAILTHTDYEYIILIDYEWPVRGINYHRAAANSERLGREVGHVINLMATHNKLFPPQQVYFVAHSLGTQIAHFASQYLQKLRGTENGKVSRFTALDPAAPLTKGCKGCPVTKDDAYFVDVIHTASGYDHDYVAWSYMWGHLSVKEPIGHVDFYPNGGGRQRNCNAIWKRVTDPWCSHGKSVTFFLKSFKDCGYFSIPCTSIDVYTDGKDSCVRAGNHVGTSKMGIKAIGERGRHIQFVDMEVYYWC